MEDKQENTSENKPARDERGHLLPGNTANPNGRPRETEETKVKRKLMKDLVAEYKESLADALPKISPVLVAKALTGDVSAIREVNDILVDKAPKNVKMEGELKITPILNGLSTNDSSK